MHRKISDIPNVNQQLFVVLCSFMFFNVHIQSKLFQKSGFKQTMLNPRQQTLLECVRKHGTISVEELAQQLNVTTQTVRRDVKAMVDASLLARYHGGVGLLSSTENIAYPERQVMHADAKRRIGRTVAARVPDGCSLILNLGTTTEEVARALQQHKNLHVVTNNLNVANSLASNPALEVIIAGGVVRARSRHRRRGHHRFHPPVQGGHRHHRHFQHRDGWRLRDFDAREVKVAQTIIEQSRQVWLVADASKFGRQALVKMAHLSQIDVLFTDAPPPPELATLLAETDVEVVIAKCQAGRHAAQACATALSLFFNDGRHGSIHAQSSIVVMRHAEDIDACRQEQQTAIAAQGRRPALASR
jgi:DeoR family glycerol-3-phosphate regulon repressor